MSGQEQPAVENPTGNEPLKWMTREQRLAFVEDTLVLLATFVATHVKGKGGVITQERTEVMEMVSAIVAQMQVRPAEEEY